MSVSLTFVRGGRGGSRQERVDAWVRDACARLSRRSVVGPGTHGAGPRADQGRRLARALSPLYTSHFCSYPSCRESRRSKLQAALSTVSQLTYVYKLLTNSLDRHRRPLCPPRRRPRRTCYQTPSSRGSGGNQDITTRELPTSVNTSKPRQHQLTCTGIRAPLYPAVCEYVVHAATRQYGPSRACFGARGGSGGVFLGVVGERDHRYADCRVCPTPTSPWV